MKMLESSRENNLENRNPNNCNDRNAQLNINLLSEYEIAIIKKMQMIF